MKKAAEYRRHANECRVLARNMSSEDERQQLLRMAGQWEGLATERERMLARNAAIESSSAPADQDDTPIKVA